MNHVFTGMTVLIQVSGEGRVARTELSVPNVPSLKQRPDATT